MAVDFSSKRLMKLLDDLRSCSFCPVRNTCRMYAFAREATDTIVKENSLESSFLGQLLARSLSWMAVEENILMTMIEDLGPMPEEGKVHPLLAEQKEIRDQMREAIKVILSMRDRGHEDKTAKVSDEGF
jgi:hypothetical protein